MNKKSRKTKTFSLRLIALLLCCVCLVGAMPLVSATGEEGSTVEAGVSPTPGVQEDEQGQQEDQDDQEGQNDPEGQDDQEGQNEPEGQDDQEDPQQGTELTAEELYNKLMACETREEMQALVDKYGDLIDEMELSDEQEKALIAKMEELGLYEAEEAGPGQSGGYSANLNVVWDTFTGTGEKGDGKGAGNSTVTSVTLGEKLLSYSNSNSVGATLSGTTLGTCFGNSNQIKLSITAAEGYYVTQVIVACAWENRAPYVSCGTWKDGRALRVFYTLDDSAYSDSKYTVTLDVEKSNFSHQGSNSEKAGYFILIKTAKVPTPVYVEYSYGELPWTLSAGSAFKSPTWAVANSSNNYGTGTDAGVLTSGTQFAYAYNNTTDIKSWKHYANTISAAAEAEALQNGYQFAGWSATWYTDCTVTDAADKRGNNKTMSFNSKYMEGTYAAGGAVQLPTHVRLVAQWEKVPTKTLTVKKTVSGNMADMTKAFTFTVTVNQGTPQTFQLKADGTKEITVPVGAVVTVSEEPDGYTNTIGNGTTSDLEYAAGEDKKSISFTMPNKNVTVVVNNEKTATIDTGIGLDTLPYVLILGLVACGGVLTLRKRRSQNAQ